MTEFNLSKYFNAYEFKNFLIQSGALYYLLAFIVTFAVIYTFILLLPFKKEEKKKKYATLIAFISGMVATYNLGNIYGTPLSLAYIGFTSYALYIIIAAAFLLMVVNALYIKSNSNGVKLPKAVFFLFFITIAYLFVTFFPTQTQVGITMASNATGLDLSWLIPAISVLSPFLIMLGVAWFILHSPTSSSSPESKNKLQDILNDLLSLEESSGSADKSKSEKKENKKETK